MQDTGAPLSASENVIGVVVCTAKRPAMLARCLESLIVQEGLPDGWRYEICVVENDAEPHSRAAVEAIAARSAVPLHYTQEPRRGIPMARNRTIAVSLERGYQWMALIDDDELAPKQWLATLANAVATFGADVANGPIARTYEAEIPDWWKPLKVPSVPTGHEIDEAPTNNTLLSIRLVSPDGMGLRFEEALTFGYEDIDFFRRAHALGAKIIWVKEAFVEEEIPATRVAPRRLLQRVEMAGAALSFATRLRKGPVKAWGRFGFKGLRRIASGVVMLLPALLLRPFGKDRSRRLFFSAMTRIRKGYGNLRGLTRYCPDYYATIDGS